MDCTKPQRNWGNHFIWHFIHFILKIINTSLVNLFIGFNPPLNGNTLIHFDLYIQTYFYFIYTICTWNNTCCLVLSLYRNFWKMALYLLLALDLCKNMLGKSKTKTKKKCIYAFRIVKTATIGLSFFFSIYTTSAESSERDCGKLQPLLGPHAGSRHSQFRMISYLPRARSLAWRWDTVLGGLQLPQAPTT